LFIQWNRGNFDDGCQRHLGSTTEQPSGGQRTVPEVFISYSQKDRELVAPVAARLSELGVDVWFDRDISAGESFGAVIRAKLKEAKAIIVCWSPEAVQSQWVDAEADYAREMGTYVPSFIVPCTLMPPFNRIHTDDLSSWTRSSNDPVWLKLVDRVAKLLGRDGVAGAARAYASGDEKALYDFARRFPEEPVAMRIWHDAEIRHRAEFSARLDEARTAAATRAARLTAEVTDIDARIEATALAFETWLTNERCGSNSSKLDPLALVKGYIPAEERKLRDDVTALSNALTQAKGVEEELEAAKGEIARLDEELTRRNDELDRSRNERANLSHIAAHAKGIEEELEAAKGEIARLNEELTRRNEELDRSRNEPTPLRANLVANDLDKAKAETARFTEEDDRVGRREQDRLQSKRAWTAVGAIASPVAIVSLIALVASPSPLFLIFFILSSPVAFVAFMLVKIPPVDWSADAATSGTQPTADKRAADAGGRLGRASNEAGTG
jgi:hypothetical protein